MSKHATARQVTARARQHRSPRFVETATAGASRRHAANHQFILPLADEMVVDLFAGGGGASEGIEQALGRPVDIAVNHDPEAIALHFANHRQTRHYASDVFEVSPRAVCGARPVGFLWASPDCTYHSKARGGKPFRDRNRARRRRGLAGVVIRWAQEVRPRVIITENVEEQIFWGPLLEDGTPCPQRRGKNFDRWIARLRNLGYVVEWRLLRASDYGAPTIRKRLFIIARCDGQPIVWPEPTHGKPGTLPVTAKKVKPWIPAGDCIDFSLPCPSIFERKKDLVDASLRRVAKGVVRYVIESDDPYIVPPERLGEFGAGHADHSDLVVAFLAKNYTGVVGSHLDDSMGTVTATDHHSLVLSHLVKLRGTGTANPTSEPLHTVSAGGTHFAEVRAFLVAYYGVDQDTPLSEPLHTVTTKQRFALVTVRGTQYAIADIGFRMLTPRELFRAQGFPEHYQIEHRADGTPLTKTAQVRMCGNSVCPPIARALVAANYGMPALRQAA